MTSRMFLTHESAVNAPVQGMEFPPPLLVRPAFLVRAAGPAQRARPPLRGAGPIRPPGL